CNAGIIQPGGRNVRLLVGSRGLASVGRLLRMDRECRRAGAGAQLLGLASLGTAVAAALVLGLSGIRNHLDVSSEGERLSVPWASGQMRPEATLARYPWWRRRVTGPGSPVPTWCSSARTTGTTSLRVLVMKTSSA